jgi:CheY-like chemotaxis protein
MMARILFVDDDPLTLTLLTKAAEIFGHQAILAHSGTEALHVVTEQSPDLIFVDRLLADMDGLAVIRNLHAYPRTISTPIVMLSAGQELDIKEAALSAGAVAFVHKPIQLQALQEIICQYTNER